MPVGTPAYRKLAIVPLALAVVATISASPRAEAVPTAASASVGVGSISVVESSLQPVPGGDSSVVVGTVENRGATTVGAGAVFVDEWDAGGNLLGTANMGLMTWSRLDPGQQSGFHIPLTKPAAFDHYTLRTWAGTDVTPANRRFTVTISDVGVRTISGSYRNDNNTPMGRIGVTAIFRDASGDVIDVGYDFHGLEPSASPVGAGESGSFSVYRTSGHFYDPWAPHTTATVIVESLDEVSPLPLTAGLYNGYPLQFGTKRQMSGWVLKQHTAQSVGGVVAILEGRRIGTAAWTTLATDTSDDLGNIVFDTRALIDGVFDYRLRIPATATREAAMSPVIRPKVQWLVELQGPAKTPKAGRAVDLSLTSSGLGRTKVTLERAQGKKWVPVETGPLDKKGRATFTATLTKGANSFRVIVPKHGEHGKLTTRVLVVRAR